MTSLENERRAADYAISPEFVQAVAWVCLVAGASMVATDIVLGVWDHDSGFFLIRGAYIAEGLRPFIDYSTRYPPLVDLITAAVVSTGVNRLLVTIALPMAWIGANTLATGVLVRCATGDRVVALLVAALFPLFAIQNGGSHLTLEHGVSFFALMAFSTLVGERHRISTRRYAACGAMLASAFLSKQHGAIAMLPAAAFLFARRRETCRPQWVAMAVGFFTPLFLVVAWLGFDLAAIYRNLVSLAAEYLSRSGAFDHTGWMKEFTRAPATALLFVLVAAVGVDVWRHCGGCRSVVAAALLGAVAEFVPRVIRNYPHYNLNMWPFLVLVLALGLAQLESRRRLAILVGLAVFVPVAYGYQALEARYQYSPLLRALAPAAAVVASVTPEGGIVRQYGSEPIIEFLAARREEIIDRGGETAVLWDGSGVYSRPPAADTTVVVVNVGQKWVVPLLAELRQQNFEKIARTGPIPEITILRYRDPQQKSTPDRTGE